MKIRITLISIILIFIAVYGWRFYANVYTNYGDCITYEAELNSNTNLLSNLENEIRQHEVIADAPTQDQIYDFVKQFVEDDYSVLSITGKRLLGSSSTTVATCTDIEELHHWNNIDIIEITLQATSYVEFLNYLQNRYLWVDKVVVYPVDNTIILSVIVLGGV